MYRVKNRKIYLELAKKYGIPPNVVEVICNHPFKFASERIQAGDNKPIMFSYFGKIKKKKRFINGHTNEQEPCECNHMDK